jgi:hypothetical protein
MYSRIDGGECRHMLLDLVTYMFVINTICGGPRGMNVEATEAEELNSRVEE